MLRLRIRVDEYKRTYVRYILGHRVTDVMMHRESACLLFAFERWLSVTSPS